MVEPMRRTTFLKAAAAACTMIMCLGVSACGNGSDSKASSSSSASSSASSSSSSSTKMHQIAGVTATGELGKKPTVAFKTPMTVENNSYAILQKGDGAVIEDGDRVCSQGIAINVKDGSELMSTWEKNTPDCSTVVSSDTSQMTAAYYNLIKGQKLNSTIAIGVNDSNSSGTSYLMVLTFVSKSKDLTKAEGTKVMDVPSDLPKVTLDKDGKPSIDMNGYKGSDSLVSQDLIKGNGAEVKDTQTVVANYTGWLLDSTQFDSSWDRGESSSFSLDSVIKGWKQGLAGHTVGSQ
ncbi:MAG: FKBP-type peptidyl-prolyl cis-trans isomerase, partial [Bifidobacterium dentium]|nr:FKBP-type peptidyl-prolyl cis-trans isomerase [Bifidobacterium dentium]